MLTFIDTVLVALGVVIISSVVSNIFPFFNETIHDLYRDNLMVVQRIFLNKIYRPLARTARACAYKLKRAYMELSVTVSTWMEQQKHKKLARKARERNKARKRNKK